jgi:RHS repeat-associated protein
MESRGWIDQRNDTETGLTYLHARYFDPQLGVFLSPDPIGVAGGMNLYGYGFGDPVNRVDRTGLDPCRVLTEGPRAGQPQCQGTYVDVRPADEYDPVEALMDLIRGGMLLMDGVQKMLTSRQAIEQERRIMQADIDEQDRLAAEAASQNSTTTTPGNEGEGSGTGSPEERTPVLKPSNGLTWEDAQANGLSWNQWWNDPATTDQDRIDAETLAKPDIDPIEVLAGVGWAVREWSLGWEIAFGKNFRLAPFGNRTGHPVGRWPHYHRRGTGPGQGMKRHRPWEGGF